MNILYTYIRKYLLKNKSLTVLSILSIACASSFFFLVICLSVNTLVGINESVINSYGNYHTEYANVQNDFIHSIQLHTKVEKVDLIEFKEQCEVNYFQSEKKNSFYLMGIEKSSFQDLGFQLIEGRYPNNPNEILISTNALNDIKLNIRVNSNIKLDKEYTIVGLISNSFLENNTSYYTLFSTYESKYPQNAYIRYYNKNEANEISNQIAHSFPNGFDKMKVNNDMLIYEGQNNSRFMTFAFIFLGLVGCTFFFMNILLIVNCYKNSYINREKHLAILKTVGVTHSQCLTMIMYEGILILVISLFVGLLSGWFIYDYIVNGLNSLLFNVTVDAFTIQKKYKFTILILTIIYVSLVSYISIYRSTKKIVYQNVSSTLQSSDEVEVMNHPYLELEKKENILIKLFKKNILQNKRAYRPLTIGLTIIISIFLFFNSLMGYLREGVFFDAHDHNFDVEVIVKNDTYPTTFMTQLKNQKHASSVVIQEKITLSTKQLQCFEDDYLNMMFYRDSIYIDLMTYSDEMMDSIVSSNQLNDLKNIEIPYGILINKAYSSAYRRFYDLVKDNQFLDLTYNKQTILSSLQLYTTDKLLTGIDYQKNPQVIVSHELFDSIFEKTKETIHEYHIYFQSNDSSSLVKEIHSIQNNLDYEIVNEQANTKSGKLMNSIIRFLSYGYVLLLGMMGFLIMSCVTSTNFDYRKKEFILFRLFGLQIKEMMILILCECVYYYLKIMIYTWTISQVINYLLYKMYFKSFGLRFFIPEDSFVKGNLIFIIILFIFMNIVYLRMKSQKYSQILKNEISLM